jgi:hypothetical protein
MAAGSLTTRLRKLERHHKPKLVHRPMLIIFGQYQDGKRYLWMLSFIRG